MIYDQKTQPVARVWSRRPTFKQFRERYHLSIHEIARRSQVRPCMVYWMDRGYRIEFSIAVRILAVFSQRAGRMVRLEEMHGIRFKQNFVVRPTGRPQGSPLYVVVTHKM